MTEHETQTMVEQAAHETPGLEIPKRKTPRTSIEIANEKLLRAQQYADLVQAKEAAKAAPRVLTECHKQALKNQDRQQALDALESFNTSWRRMVDLQLPAAETQTEEQEPEQPDQ